MNDEHNAEYVTRLREGHRLISAHRCRCGWEGDDAVTHVIDVLHISPVHVDEVTHIGLQTHWTGAAINSKRWFVLGGKALDSDGIQA